MSYFLPVNIQNCLNYFCQFGVLSRDLLRLSMFDTSLMLRLKFPVVYRIHPESDKFAMGGENKLTQNVLTTLIN